MSIPAHTTTQCKFLSSRGMFDMQRALLSFQLFSFWTWNTTKIALNTDNDNNAYDDDNDDDDNDDDNGGGSGCSSSSNITVATTRSNSIQRPCWLCHLTISFIFTHTAIWNTSKQHNKMQNTKLYIKLIRLTKNCSLCQSCFQTW